jgi:hypothetical protein
VQGPIYHLMLKTKAIGLRGVGFTGLGGSNASIYRPGVGGLGRGQDVKMRGSQANSSVSKGREELIGTGEEIEMNL